jgi:hypothetical protein
MCNADVFDLGVLHSLSNLLSMIENQLFSSDRLTANDSYNLACYTLPQG